MNIVEAFDARRTNTAILSNPAPELCSESMKHKKNSNESNLPFLSVLSNSSKITRIFGDLNSKIFLTSSKAVKSILIF